MRHPLRRIRSIVKVRMTMKILPDHEDHSAHVVEQFILSFNAAAVNAFLSGKGTVESGPEMLFDRVKAVPGTRLVELFALPVDRGDVIIIPAVSQRGLLTLFDPEKAERPVGGILFHQFLRGAARAAAIGAVSQIKDFQCFHGNG